jgi:ABC-2 type transport system permease protein
MERFLTIIKKEFLHIFRDPRTMGLILLLPAVLLILLGYGVSGESNNYSMAVADLSQTEESRRYIEYYTAGPDFSFDYRALNEDELIQLINEDKVKAGLLIPENFGRELVRGNPVHSPGCTVETERDQPDCCAENPDQTDPAEREWHCHQSAD